MALMPVSKTSVWVTSSSKEGAGWWMGYQRTSSGTGRPSTGSPVTLHTRPSVEGPTGMRMGRPVSRTRRPRLRPSVDDIDTQRTTPPSSSDSTSSVALTSPMGVRPSATSAVWMAGTWSSNLTSTMEPTTRTMRPVPTVLLRRW